MKLIRSLLKHFTGGGKSLIRKKSILISSLAVLVLTAAVGAGVVLHNHKSSAMETFYVTDSNTNICWSYTIDTTLKNGDATEIYIFNTKDISSDITVPESFSDSYGTHFVTSIGMANLSDRDSFFFNSSVSALININININNCSRLERINDFFCYRNTRINNIELPMRNISIGKYICYHGDNTTIITKTPNADFSDNSGSSFAYDGEYGVTFKGPERSTTRDFVGSKYEEANYISDGTQTVKVSLSYTGQKTDKVLSDYVYLPIIKGDGSYDDLLAQCSINVPPYDHHDFNGYFSSVKPGTMTGVGSALFDPDGNVTAALKDMLTDGFSDTTFYADFSPCVYRLSYDPSLTDEETKGLPSSYTYGVSLSVPQITKKGHTFGGWFNNAALTGTSYSTVQAGTHGALTLYPKFTANTYYISYNPNGASGSMNPASCVYGKDFSIAPCSFTKTGYSFDGWNSKKDGSGITYRAGAVTKDLSDKNHDTVTLFAQWKADSVSYTVSHVYRGLDGDSDEIVTETKNADTDSSVSPALKPRTGFVSPSVQGTTVKGDGSTTVTYVYERQQYHVSVTDSKGIVSVSGTGVYPFGSSVTLHSVRENGYSILSWSADTGITADTSAQKDKTQADFILGASDVVFTIETMPNTYGITYTLGEGASFTGQHPSSYTHGTQIVLPDESVLERKGYSFDGWYDTPGFTGSRITKLSESAYGYKNFYAKWVPKDYAIRYVLNGGSITGSYETAYRFGVGASLPADSAVKRNGYLFAGWYSSEECSGNRYSQIGTSETGEKTFYAKWSPNTYSITYITDGGTIKDRKEVEEYTAGNVFVLPDASEMSLAGFAFAGWYTDSFQTGDPVTQISESDYGPKVFYAKWEASPYTITYDTDGGTISGEYATSYRFGTGASLPENVTKEGFSFTGWWNGTSFIKKIGNRDYGNKSFSAIWQNNASTGVVSTDIDTADIEGAEKADLASSSVSDTGYYYSLLDGTAKSVYAALYTRYHLDTSKGKDQFSDPVILTSASSFTAKNVADAQTALLWDHPEIFWIRYFAKSAVQQENGMYVCAVSPVEAYDRTLYSADLMQYDYFFNAAVTSAGITERDDVYARITKIHDYVTKTYSYDNLGITLNAATSNDTRSGGRMLVTKKGCCEAYAKVTKILCDRFGIPCILVKSRTHMWNEVCIDGVWYGLDTTWDSSRKNAAYFLKGSAVFSDADHTVSNAFYVTADGEPVTAYGCFDVPAIGNDYTVPHNGQTAGSTGTDTQTKKGPSANKTAAKTTTLTAGKLRYRILSKNTVTVTSVKSRNVKAVTIPASVKISRKSYKVVAVAPKAFMNCKKLAKVTVGANVTKIGSKAFLKDKKLKNIVMKSKKTKTIGAKAFAGIHKKAVFHAPKKAKKMITKKLTKKTGFSRKTMRIR